MVGVGVNGVSGCIGGRGSGSSTAVFGFEHEVFAPPFSPLQVQRLWVVLVVILETEPVEHLLSLVEQEAFTGISSGSMMSSGGFRGCVFAGGGGIT